MGPNLQETVNLVTFTEKFFIKNVLAQCISISDWICQNRDYFALGKIL